MIGKNLKSLKISKGQKMEDRIEVSLKDIYNQLVKFKYHLVILNIIIFLFASYLIYSDKSQYKGSLNIYLLNSIEHNKYDEFNMFVNEYDVDREYFRLLLIEEIADRDEVAATISELNIINKEEFNDDVSYNFALRQAAFGLEIIEPNVKNLYNNTELIELPIYTTKGDDFFTIKFKHENKEIIKEVFSNVVLSSNEKVKIFLTDKLKNMYENKQRSNEYQIMDFAKQKAFYENIRYDFINDRKKYLVEQAEIARSLEISNPTLDSSTFPDETGDMLTTLEKEQPFYYRGYIAIEKEIELLNSRGDNINVFDRFYKDIKTVDNKIQNLESRIYNLESDLTVTRLKNAFKNSPLNKGIFQSANFDFANIYYEQDSNFIRYAFFALIASIILSTSYVILGSILNKIRIS